MTAMTTAAGGRATLAQPAPGRPDASIWSHRTVVALALAVPTLAVAAVTLHLHNGPTPLTEWWYGSLVLAVTLLVPALLIAWNRPANPLGWLLGAACLLEAVCSAGREYLIYGLLGGTAPGWLWLGWLADSCYLVAIATLPVALMLFPDGRLGARWQRVALAVPMIGLAFSWFGYLFTGDVAHIRGHALANPGAALLPQPVTSTALMIGQPLLLLSLLLAVVALFVRLRRARGVEREQLKWVVWAGSIGAVELVTEFIPGNGAAVYTSMVTDALLVGAFAIAILRHRLLDIDVVINRTLVFAILSALVVGGYLAIVLTLSVLLGQPVHAGAGLAAAAFVGVGFAPARAFVQRRVDRLVYGERKNPYRVVTELGRSLESPGPGSELDVVVTTLVQTLRLPHAAIVDPDGTPLAATGTPGERVVERRLTYQGSAVGSLLVSQRSGSSGFSRDEQRLLADLARQIGAAVHAVRLSAALQASRHRLVSAKEEERRRLRRDLHDGLGPTLAAVGLKLDAARSLVTRRPEEATQVLAAVRDDIHRTIDDIRRLVYELRPPSLDELGLVEALRESVRGFGACPSGPAITVWAAASLPPLPAAVEVAAYRIVTEALTNVVRHADAAHCEVELTCDEALRIVVRDDGVGGCDDGVGGCDGWRAGVGTSSMAERAAELGGSLAITAPAGGGTEIRVHLPLR